MEFCETMCEIMFCDIMCAGSSGDGGSHWSFQPFPGGTAIGRDLNIIGCKFQFPVFPTGSPYVTSVGGITWGDSPQDPVAWSDSGGGFAWEFPRATFQDATVKNYLAQASGTDNFPPSTSFNSSNRAYPDISAVSVRPLSGCPPPSHTVVSFVWRSSVVLAGICAPSCPPPQFQRAPN